MSFTIRWVCKSTANFNFDELEKRFESNIFSTYRNSAKTELKYLIKPHQTATSNSASKYLIATLYFEFEEKIKGCKITDAGKIDKKEDETIILTDAVDFWVSNQNFVFFSKTENSRNMQFVRTLLSKTLFDYPNKIKLVLFDIEKIEGDIVRKNRRNMWTFAFSERRGKIDAGRVWGNNISVDAIYKQAKECSRNTVGVIIPIGDKMVKISINHNGTIFAFSDFRGLEDKQKLLNILDEYTKYAVIVDI